MKYVKKMFAILVFLTCFFLLNQASRASLFISEISIDGTNERIELTNSSHNTFFGDVILQGAKSSEIKISLEGLEPQISYIIGDTLDILSGFTLFSGYSFAGAGLSLKDTSAQSFSLYFSGELIDERKINKEQVNAYDNNGTTFHRKDPSGTGFLIGGPSPRSNEVFYTNDESTIMTTSDIDAQNGTGEIIFTGHQSPFVGNSALDNLNLLTGNNLGILSGSGNILSGENYSYTGSLIGEEPIFLSGTQLGSGIHIPNLQNGFTYQVTGSIFEKKLDNEVMGSLNEDIDRVKIPGCDIQTRSTDLGRTLYVQNTTCDTTYVYQRKEISSLPGTSTRTEDIGRGCTLPVIIPDNEKKDVLLHVYEPEKENKLLCEAHFEVLVQKEIIDKTLESFTGTVVFTALQPSVVGFGENIEIIVQDAYSGIVHLVGGGYGGGTKSFFLSGFSGETFLLFDENKSNLGLYTGQISGFISIQGLSLTDSGEELSLVRHNGQQMDTAVYYGHKKGSRLTFGGKYSGENRVFIESYDVDVSEQKKINEEDQDNLLSTKENIIQKESEYELPGNSFSGSSSLVIFDGTTPTISGTSYLVEETQQTYWSTGIVSLVGVLPNPDGADGENEGIRLVFLGTGTDVRTELGMLRINSGSRQRQIILEDDLFIGEHNLTIFGDFGLYNRASCVRLEKKDGSVVYDEVCYPLPISGKRYHLPSSDKIKTEEFTGEPSSDILCPEVVNQKNTCTDSHDTFTGEVPTGSSLLGLTLAKTEIKRTKKYALSIDSIVPNPKGVDTNKEKIQIVNYGTEDVSLSGFILNAGSRQKKISEESVVSGSVHIPAGGSTLLVGTFGLYNKKACVRLEDSSGNEIDVVCYPSPKSDVEYSIQSILDSESDLINFEKKFTGEPQDDDIFLGEVTSNTTKLDDFGDILISVQALVPNPEGSDANKESIELLNAGTGVINLGDIELTTRKRSTRLSSSDKNPLLLSGERLTLTGSFGLYNKASCVRLQHTITGQIYDHVCYPKPTSGKRYEIRQNHLISEPIRKQQNDSETLLGLFCPIKSFEQTYNFYEGDTQDTSVFAFDGRVGSGSLISGPEIHYLTGILSLEALLPNPSGADSGYEGIRLKNISTRILDLSNFRLNSGKRKTNLTGGVLQPSGEITHIQTLGLYNKPSCVRLESLTGIIYDEFCYPQPKDNQWYASSVSFPTSDLDIGKISIQVSEDEACLVYLQESILCKKIKELSKNRKKIERLDISLKKIMRNNETLKEKYKQKNNLLKNEISLHKEFIYESMGILREDRGPVFYDTDLVSKYTTRKQLQKDLGSLSFAQQQFFDNQVMSVYKLHGNELPLEHLVVQDIYEHLFDETKQFTEQVMGRLRSS